MPIKNHPSTSNITPGHVRAFQAVTSGIYGEVSLFSCTINREPGVALVLVQDVGEAQIAVMPLFVAITESMDVEFDEEESGSGGGGGSDRPNPGLAGRGRDRQQAVPARCFLPLLRCAQIVAVACASLVCRRRG